MPITFNNEGSRYRLPAKRAVRAWLERVAQSEGYAVGDINYVFCSSERQLELNREFLKHDYFTDIITFDYSDLEVDRVVSGDIYIDVETVRDNARGLGVSFCNEMLRVVLHGVLHLCGYKDKTPKEERAMRQKEDFYLTLWREINFLFVPNRRL